MTPSDAKKAAAGGAAAAIRVYMLMQLEDVLDCMEDTGGPRGEAFDAGDAELVRSAWIDIVKELCQRGDVRYCRVCGCTDAIACRDGCEWVGEDLCSSHGAESSPSPILVVPR